MDRNTYYLYIGRSIGGCMVIQTDAKIGRQMHI